MELQALKFEVKVLCDVVYLDQNRCEYTGEVGIVCMSIPLAEVGHLKYYFFGAVAIRSLVVSKCEVKLCNGFTFSTAAFFLSD